MEHVDPTTVESWIGPAAEKRPLGRALGTEHVAINYYELAPGDSFAFGYHRHQDQEEVFYVLEGVVTFDTESGTVVVDADEAIRFAPGEWQRGRNAGSERVRALALGAPADASEAEMVRACADCGGRTENRIERVEDDDALVTRCEACGAITGRFE